jgi:multidrug efflux pump subunit AcrA (membrane-fusion protein)
MAKAQRSRWCRSIWIIFGLAIVVGGFFEVRHISSRVQPSGSNAAVLAAMPATAATASIIDAIGTVQAIDSVSLQPRVTGTIEKIACKRGHDGTISAR